MDGISDSPPVVSEEGPLVIRGTSVAMMSTPRLSQYKACLRQVYKGGAGATVRVQADPKWLPCCGLLLHSGYCVFCIFY